MTVIVRREKWWKRLSLVTCPGSLSTDLGIAEGGGEGRGWWWWTVEVLVFGPVELGGRSDSPSSFPESSGVRLGGVRTFSISVRDPLTCLSDSVLEGGFGGSSFERKGL